MTLTIFVSLQHIFLSFQIIFCQSKYVSTLKSQRLFNMSENKNQQSPAPLFPTSESCSPRGNHFQHFGLFFFIWRYLPLCFFLKKKKCYFLLSFDFLVPPLLFQYSCMALFG